METTERLGRLTLRQATGCFKLGSDTLSLGAFVTLRRGLRVCDLGCGSGVLGLLLLEREASLHLTGVELDPSAAALATRNYGENGVLGSVLTGDLRDPSLLPSGTFDLVVSNPPWFSPARGRSGGPTRCEETCTLEEVAAAAGRLVRNRGRVALVHRPERLREVFSTLTDCGLEPKRLQWIQHSVDHPPSTVLVEAVKQGRPGLAVLPPLLLNAHE